MRWNGFSWVTGGGGRRMALASMRGTWEKTFLTLPHCAALLRFARMSETLGLTPRFCSTRPCTLRPFTKRTRFSGPFSSTSCSPAPLRPAGLFSLLTDARRFTPCLNRPFHRPRGCAGCNIDHGAHNFCRLADDAGRRTLLAGLLARALLAHGAGRR
jgi:hypothetical protein